MIFGYAIANGNECLICGHYFKKIIVDMGIDWETFEFSDEETDLLNFAEAMVEAYGDPNYKDGYPMLLDGLFRSRR